MNKTETRFIRFLDAYLKRHANSPAPLGGVVLGLCSAYTGGTSVARIICRQNIRDFELDALIARNSKDARFLRVYAIKGNKRKVCYLPYRGQPAYAYPMVAPRGFKLSKFEVISAVARHAELSGATVPTNRTWVDLAPLPKGRGGVAA